MLKFLERRFERMNITWKDILFDEESLRNTVNRVKRFQKEWEEKRKFKFTVFKNPGYNQMIILRDIDFASLCSHHLLPFKGKGHIGYIPDKHICGISKLARALDKFACKPQIQEKLTEDLADFLQEKLKPIGLMIVLEAQHDCMQIRGVKKPNSTMVTSAIRGSFEEYRVRYEFLQLIRNGS
jgi:GTP cyclohydrolase I